MDTLDPQTPNYNEEITLACNSSKVLRPLMLHQLPLVLSQNGFS